MAATLLAVTQATRATRLALLILPLVFALPLHLACAQTEAELQATQPSPQFENPAAAVALYRAAVTSAMKEIDRSQTLGRPLSIRLLRIRSDIFPIFSLGSINASGSMRATESGTKQGVWGLVLALDHPLLASSGPTLTAGEQDSIDSITIRPDLLSERWAGVFMIHEFSHSLDQRQEGAQSTGCWREFEAYLVEQQYYNLLTQGAFHRALDEIIAGLPSAGPQDLSADSSLLKTAFDSLEADLEERPALSAAERQMRDGFYYVSLVDRIGQGRGDKVADRCEAMAASIAAASKY